MDRAALVAEIRAAAFTQVRLREGYAIDDVDAFLTTLADIVAAGQPVKELVDAARFSPVRMQEGYDMGEVDWFLDEVVAKAETLPVAPAPVTPTPAPAPAPAPVTVPSPEPATPVIQERRGLWKRLLGR